MKGGEALVETLIAHGVDTGFTVPGESFLPVIEALRQARNAFRLVTVRQEGGGTFAAEAYAKLTGRPAVCFVSRGPGATNASIGVHTAMQDCTPMLLMIGHVRTRSKGREAFQEVDHHRMFGALAKEVIEPATAADVADCTARALRIAMSGRPGPTVLVMPRDVGEADAGEVVVPHAGPRPAIGADPTEVARAAQLLAVAERPLILLGEGAAGAAVRGAVEALAERSGAPVMAGYRRQDAFDNLHPAYAGHLEINRLAWQLRGIEESDLIVAVGSRLDAITSEEYALPRRGQKLLLIYPDPDVVARFPSAAALVADVGPGARALAEALPPVPQARLARRDALHRHYLELSEPGHIRIDGAVDLSACVAEAQRQLPEDATVLTDGGSFARWVHRYYRFRRPATAAGPIAGAMGYAVPGAIGAHFAKPNVPTVAFVGDGGFLMTGQELATAVECDAPIKVVVCDNGAHGSILEGQRKVYGQERLYGTVLKSPDFAGLGRAYGAGAWTVEETGQFAGAFAAALKHPGPALLHVKTDMRDIVPFGAGAEDKV